LREVDGAEIHRLGDILVNNIDDEFVCISDILCGVLPDYFFRRTIGYANGNNGWIGADIIVGAKRGRIKATFMVVAGNPGNRSRGNEADEQVIGLVVTYFGEIKVHGLVSVRANQAGNLAAHPPGIIMSGEKAASCKAPLSRATESLVCLQRWCRVTR